MNFILNFWKRIKQIVLNLVYANKKDIFLESHIEGLHHFHVRKRIYKNYEPYPHPHSFKRFIDRSVYFFGIVGPLMTIPQIMNIWIEKNATGVSIISWSAYLIVSCFWFMYGIVHKERPIIFTYAIWIIMDLLIIFGILIFNSN